MWPLAWELPYATDVAIKKKKKRIKERNVRDFLNGKGAAILETRKLWKKKISLVNQTYSEGSGSATYKASLKVKK